MKSDSHIIFYSLIEAVGTVLTALSGTCFPGFDADDSLRVGLDIVGNSLQAAGNALETETVSLFADGGNALMASGNSITVSGLIGCFDASTSRKTLAAGDLIQALGNLILAGKTIEIGKRTIGQANFLIGSLLQATGNTLQAAGIDREQNHRSLIAIGGWIQATGAMLSFVSMLQEARESERMSMKHHPIVFRDECYFVPYL